MLSLLIACLSAPEDSAEDAQTTYVNPPETEYPLDLGCTSKTDPVLALHGFIASGDTYINFERFFVEHGLCPSHFIALDWNTFSEDREDSYALMNRAIDELKIRSGASQITLIGHSAGGGLALDFLNISEHQGSVGHYIHIGSFPQASPASIPMLNIYSQSDLTVTEATAIEEDHVSNIDLIVQDHYEIATSSEAFDAIKTFLSLTFSEDNKDLLLHFWGKGIYFGENMPIADGSLSIYELSNGVRTSEEALVIAQSNSFGLFGPLPLKTNTHYEFCLTSDEGPQVCHYLMQQATTTQFLRFRGLPEEGFASTLLSAVPLDADETMTMVSYSQSKAMIFERDSLIIESEEVITESRASADQTLIALFHYDNNEDLMADEDPALFEFFPFLNAMDQPLLSSGPPVEISFNGKNLWVPRSQDSVQIAVLE
ncbi:MAG: hypothetical protein CMK59_12505 [Proteobacteria bacterium]|nr:hypothetical protein [Pseudomonadota bacterium]